MKMERKFLIFCYDAHLLGEMEKTMEILGYQGKYIFIKHDKDTDTIAVHYHIYFESNVPIRFSTVERIFRRNVSSKVFVKIVKTSRDSIVKYMLNDKYTKEDIVTNIDNL